MTYLIAYTVAKYHYLKVICQYDLLKEQPKIEVDPK